MLNCVNGLRPRDSKCQRMTFFSNFSWKEIKVIGQSILTLSRSRRFVLGINTILGLLQPKGIVPNLR